MTKEEVLQTTYQKGSIEGKVIYRKQPQVWESKLLDWQQELYGYGRLQDKELPACN